MAKHWNRKISKEDILGFLDMITHQGNASQNGNEGEGGGQNW